MDGFDLSHDDGDEDEVADALDEGIAEGDLIPFCAKCQIELDYEDYLAHACPRCGELDFETEIEFQTPDMSN